MFEALDAAIAGLELCGDRDAIVGILQRLERLEAKAVVAVSEFEISQQWAIDGAANFTQWLTSHCGITREEAHRLRVLGRCTRLFPETAAAYSRGDLSPGQLRVIALNVPSELEDVFAEREAAILPALLPLDLKNTERAMKHWKAITEDEFDLGEPREPKAGELRHRQVGDRWRTTGSSNNDDGQIIQKAIQRALDDDPGNGLMPYAQRFHDAFMDICRHYLSYDDSRISPRQFPHLNVAMTSEEMLAMRGGRYDDGSPVHPTTLGRLMCDSVISRIVHDRGVILDYGRGVRTVPDSLRRAVIQRDRQCRFEGCDRPPQWCEVHHHLPWQQGGTTSLHNSVLLCSRHHHLLHKPDWTSTLACDGTFVVTSPHGRTMRSRPPPTGG